MIYEAVLSSTQDSTSLPVLRCIENGKRTWDITLKQDAGESSAPYTLEKAWRVRFLCKAAPEIRGLFIDKDCTVVNPLEGKVRLELGPKELRADGMWWGAIQIFDEEALLDQFQCWLMIDPSLSVRPKSKQLTIQDVRSFLFDRCAEDNRLLAGVQFRDDQIVSAMRMAIDEWNATPPDVAFLTTVNFPYKSQWLKGTVAYLLRSAAFQQVRNNATYNTGTVAVNDSDKGPMFKQMGDDLYKEWIDWVRAEKRMINIELGWGYNRFAQF